MMPARYNAPNIDLSHHSICSIALGAIFETELGLSLGYERMPCVDDENELFSFNVTFVKSLSLTRVTLKFLTHVRGHYFLWLVGGGLISGALYLGGVMTVNPTCD